MARLASETKMGFYATSTKTIGKIMQHCITMREETYALDACCGEGQAIEFFKEEYGCYNFAVELNEARAKTAATRNIGKVLNADAINGVRKSNRWVGFQFLNPPYDFGADGERLELKFIERWGLATIEGGALMLVVNPSSADEEMAKKLILQGYEPLWSVYDPENEDYQKFGQFFIILRRVRENYRSDLDEFMVYLQNPVNLDDWDEVEKFSPKRGIPPQMFKEMTMPHWKVQAMLRGSSLHKAFFDDLRKADLGGGSIEVPNEGQGAILIAAGKLNKRITLKTGEDVILKGTVKKIRTNKAMMNEEDGNIDKVKLVDAYQTVVYCLNMSKGGYFRLS
ncbi:DUF6094 domain-containing protein [Thiomicrolovo sp. ZZH C-3]